MSIEGLSPLLPGNAPFSNRLAIHGLSRRPMTYGELDKQTRYTLEALNEHGIGRNNRVATALADGPIDSALSNILTAGVSFAPHDPDQPQPRFEMDFVDLKPKVLLVDPYNGDTPAIAAARKFNIPIVVVQDAGRKAGEFVLDFGSMPKQSITHGGFNTPSNEAMIMRTSGTTGHPKTAPHELLTIQAGIDHCAQSIGGFKFDDRGFCTGSGFHVHKKMFGILAPLSFGSEICCAPKYSASRYWGWLDEFTPTWITTVSSQWNIIAGQLDNPENQAIIDKISPNLRLLRASSTSLPPSTLHKLEAAFIYAVMIEAYSMSENAHVVTSNLPDRSLRKPGTVGFPVNGVELLIVDEDTFWPVPRGKVGRIAFKSDSLFKGYEDNPAANAESFRNGWFMPTDYGLIDEDGHLVIFGRNTDIIDRGGENISAPWLDAVVGQLPGVSEAMTFAFPDPILGQRVATAVVLRDGFRLTEDEIQTHVAGQMAKFYVPDKVVFTDTLPKNPVGKLLRPGAAKHYGLV